MAQGRISGLLSWRKCLRGSWSAAVNVTRHRMSPFPPLSADRLGAALVMHDRWCHTRGWVVHGREFRVARRHVHWYPNCCWAPCLAISQQGLSPCSMSRYAESSSCAAKPTQTAIACFDTSSLSALHVGISGLGGVLSF